MRKGAGVYEQLDDEEQDEALAGRCLACADNGIVKARICEYAREDLIGNLDDDIGDEERLPGIRLGRALTNFVERSLGDEEGLDLLTVSKLVDTSNS